MSDGDAIADGEFSIEDYYSLLELLDKLGKEGVAELVSKGKPQRITRGDMIYFLKSDVNRILGEDVLENSDSVELIVDNEMDEDEQDINLASQLVFTQSLIKRYKVGQEEEIYYDKIIDLSKEFVYGRSKGDPQDQEILKPCGIISAVHGKLFLDEECNLLYENIGANKSKIRGYKDKTYTILEKDEIAVLIAQDSFAALQHDSPPLTASIKLGFQLKPHFIVRISACRK